MHLHRICGTDVCVAPCAPYPCRGYRNTRSLPPIQDKRERPAGRVGQWERCLHKEILSPVIALCSCPGGRMTAVKGGGVRVMIYCPQKPSAKMPSTADKNLTHCVQRADGCTNHPQSFTFTVYFPR